MLLGLAQPGRPTKMVLLLLQGTAPAAPGLSPPHRSSRFVLKAYKRKLVHQDNLHKLSGP